MFAVVHTTKENLLVVIVANVIILVCLRLETFTVGTILTTVWTIFHTGTVVNTNRQGFVAIKITKGVDTFLGKGFQLLIHHSKRKLCIPTLDAFISHVDTFVCTFICKKLISSRKLLELKSFYLRAITD